MEKYNHCKDNSKLSDLIQYIENRPYIDIMEQRAVCESFGLPFKKKLFRHIYRRKFYDYLLGEITTVATVTKKTGIPQKYLTCCKIYYQKRNLLKVLYKDICPTTGSRNVQFVTTNKDLFNHG